VRRDDSAAYAANWWTVLAVDALLGLVAVVGGLVLGSYGNILGIPLVILGVAYVVFVFLRLRRWRRLRDEAGLR
jgi:hypothetical protein